MVGREQNIFKDRDSPHILELSLAQARKAFPRRSSILYVKIKIFLSICFMAVVLMALTVIKTGASIAVSLAQVTTSILNYFTANKLYRFLVLPRSEKLIDHNHFTSPHPRDIQITKFTIEESQKIAHIN